MQQSPHRGESFFRPATLIAAATSSSNSGPGGQPDRSATAVFRSPAESACDSPGGRAYGPAGRYGQRRFAAGPGVRSTRRRIGGPNRLPPVKTPESDSARAAPQKQLPAPEHKSTPKKRIAPDERSPSRAIFYPQPAACRRHCATTALPPPPFPAAGKRLPSKQSDRRFSTGTEKRHRPEHTSRTNRGRFSASALPILRSSRILPSAPCPAGTADPPRHAVRPVARPRSVSDTHRTGRNRKRQEAQRAQKRYPR